MRRPVYVIAGVLLALAGVIWTLQGLNLLGQSGGMNGVKLWAVIGPLVLIAGAVLTVRGLRHRPIPDPLPEEPTTPEV